MPKQQLNLNAASFASPVFIDEKHPLASRAGYSYFYNGHVFYSLYSGAFSILPMLAPDTLKVKPYGLADASHVVVGDQVIEVKPGKFKRIGKHDHFYFIKGTKVYQLNSSDNMLMPVPNADPKTLKVIDEDIAEDEQSVFFNRRLDSIAKETLGAYQIRNYDLMVVHGEHSVYVLGEQLDVDAPSIEFTGGDYVPGYGAVFGAHDQQGSLKILVTLSPRQGESKVRVIRDDAGQNEAEVTLVYWQEQKKKDDKASPLIPGNFTATLPENLSRLGYWLNNDFTEKWELQRTNLQLYRLVSAYLAWSADAFEADASDAYLHAGICMFERFTLYAFLCPGMLHQAARLYTLAGEQKKAIECCERALHYRYAKFAELLTEPTLAPLTANSDFTRLEKDFASLADDFSYISLPILEALENAVASVRDDEALVSWMRQYVLYNYRFYQQSALLAQLDNASAEEAAALQTMAQKNQFYFDNYMLLEGTNEVISEHGQRQWAAFLRYHEYQQLQPLAYLRMANIFFLEAHQWASWKYKHLEDTRQVLAPRLKEAAQMVAHFQKLLGSVDTQEKNRILQAAQSYPIVQLMQASGKSLSSA